MPYKLSCPSCKSSFRVPDGAISDEGRNVKCANCSNVWLATSADLIAIEDETPQNIESDAQEDQEDSKEPTAEENADNSEAENSSDKVDSKEEGEEEEFRIEDLPEPQQTIDEKKDKKPLKPKKKASSANRKLTVRLAMGSIAMALLFVATSLFAWHSRIREASLAANSLYGVMGYYDTDGIKLADLQYTKIPLLNKVRYHVKGALINTNRTERAFPTLRIRIVDKSGKTVKAQEGRLNKMLKYGEPFYFSKEFDGSALGRDHELIVEIGNALEISDRK